MADAGATLLSRTRSPPYPMAPAMTTIGTKTDEELAKSLAKVATLGESGAIGVPMGAPASTGFRSAKHTPEEWHQSNYQRYYQSFTDRDNAERLKHESKQLSNETEALTQRTQADATKKLAERMNDINFWKVELDREIKEMIEETDLLCAQKKRLENALDATEVPLNIAQDNLDCRSRRQEVDLVGDRVELALNKVSESIVKKYINIFVLRKIFTSGLILPTHLMKFISIAFLCLLGHQFIASNYASNMLIILIQNKHFTL